LRTRVALAAQVWEVRSGVKRLGGVHVCARQCAGVCCAGGPRAITRGMVGGCKISG
jgi:hypothetical protein